MKAYPEWAINLIFYKYALIFLDFTYLNPYLS